MASTRIIRVIKIGTGSNNKPYARVVVDLEPTEQMAVLKLATELGCSAPPAAFGLLNGVPEDKLALLVPGDLLTAEQLTVSFRKSEYEDSEGVARKGIDANVRVAGAVSRSAAPVAQCDW